MVTVYSSQISGNCYKVRLLLTQLDVPFRVVEVDAVAGQQRSPEHLRRNSNGKVPVVDLGDGDFLPESGAILYHFAEGTPLWPDARRERAAVLQWMFFEQYTHEPAIAVARFLQRFRDGEQRFPERLTALRDQGHKALGVMEQHLATHEYFAAGRYTIADIALYAYTHMAGEGGFDLDRYPAVRAWLGRVAAQPRHITIDHVC